MALVPCEVCGEMIPFEEYSDHIEECITSRVFRMTFSIQNDTVRSIDNMDVVFVNLGEYLGMVEHDDYEINSRLSEYIGNVEIGVEDIDKVSVRVENTTEGEICAICRETLSNNVRKLLCNHVYCDECITKWLSAHKRCPVCMLDLEEERAKVSNPSTLSCNTTLPGSTQISGVSP